MEAGERFGAGGAAHIRVNFATSEEILGMFQQFNTEEGITIILVTHDAEVASHAQRVIRIRDGLIEHGVVDAATHEPLRQEAALATMAERTR